MTRLLVILTVLACLLSATATDAQRNRGKKKGPPAITLDEGKVYQSEKYGLQFKIPKQFRKLRASRLPKDLSAVFGAQGRDWEMRLGTVGARELENVREGIIANLQKQAPQATTRILRGGKVGGMDTLTIVISNLRGSTGPRCTVFNAVDVPLRGIIKLEFRGPQKDMDELTKISAWIMPWFRLTGEDGEDILFSRRVFDAKHGITFRLLDGSKPKKDLGEGVACEGQTQSGVWYRIEKVTDAPAGKLDEVMKVWVKGAKALVPPYATPSGLDGNTALLGMFDRYSGRPARSVLVFRANDQNTYRLETAGGKFPMPLVVAEEMASVLNWLDIAALEVEAQALMVKLDEAIKKKDARKIKRYARRSADRYYLAGSLEIARKVLKVGDEKSQIYALKAIERGGNVEVDFNSLKRVLSDGKFKDRTKVRVAAASAMGALVNMKTTNYLLRMARGDKDDKVAKAAAIALGRHKPNRKAAIPKLISLYTQAMKDRKTKSDKKRLRASRVCDAYRSALRGLTGQDFTDPKVARKWLNENKKTLNAEEVIK